MNKPNRNILRSLISAITSVCLAKGMDLAAHNNDILWTIAFALVCCFWIVGMFKRQE